MSDDVAIAIEPDGRLQLVWVEQDKKRITFRDADGEPYDGLMIWRFIRSLETGETLIVDSEHTASVVEQLEDYFSGRRSQFDLVLAPRGTDFQHAVWAELRRIPPGETRTYGEIARALGRPGASRAVGRANATNPLPIVVPCHRVVGADGSLTGFAGGLGWKRRLLAIEGVETH